MGEKTLIERLRAWADNAVQLKYRSVSAVLLEAADTLSRQAARIAELERGFSKIADGRLQPNKEGHYLAHREAVRIARALLSPAVEGGGGERNSSSVAESAATGGPTPAATSAAPSGEEEALRRAGYDRQMDITEALMGPHEWGYRDPVEGGWIDDYTPFAAAELIAHLREQVEVHHAVNRHWEARHRMRQQAQEELAGQSRTPQVEGDKSRDTDKSAVLCSKHTQSGTCATGCGCLCHRKR